MFATPAYAQTAGAADPSGGFISLLPLVLVFVIFYFFLIRPQSKRAKEHRAMLEAIRRGDQVITGGGIHAKVTKVGEGEEIEVEIAQGVKVKLQRSTILTVQSKTEPVKES
ncbi:MAG: preprotein translocase subunit YajC [Pseudomonadota bacterium]